MSNPSPVCEIKVGAAAYVTAVGGVDMTLGASIVIKLSSQVDVDSWLIECATTDDTSDADTVTASLTIDSTERTAAFTAPATEGKTYRFRSLINGGVDRNGVVQASYETTFCLYTTTNGRRCMAADETTEGDTTFGWIKWMNGILRAGVGGGGGGAEGIDYQFQYYSGGSQLGATGLNYNPTTHRVDARINQASIVAAAVAQATLTSANIVAATVLQATLTNASIASGSFRGVATIVNGSVASMTFHSGTIVSAMIGAGVTAATGMHLVRPIMLAPVLAGTAVFTGTDIVANGLADHKPFSAVRNLTTSNANVTPVFAWKILDEAVTSVVVEVNAVPSGGGAGGSYCRRVMIRSDGGTATCGSVESSWNDEHTASGIGFTGLSVGSGIYIGASGATGFVNLKGTATGAIKWGVTVTVQPTSWA